ncbi:MAG: type II toxin-antitoxin system RelE/ParE family toxin [Myxococcota bacterium]
MAFRVFLTEDAEQDLEELYDFIAEHDAPERAEHVLRRIEEVLETLASFPQRGAIPKELLSLGIRNFREVFFKPYRMIFRIQGRAVYVYLVADGRREMQSLLQRRLLSAR